VTKRNPLNKKMGRPALNKKIVSIRLTPQTIVSVRTATVTTGNMSEWIEGAIAQKLQKDRIY
jgi:hypothetical protein